MIWTVNGTAYLPVLSKIDMSDWFDIDANAERGDDKNQDVMQISDPQLFKGYASPLKVNF